MYFPLKNKNKINNKNDKKKAHLYFEIKEKNPTCLCELYAHIAIDPNIPMRLKLILYESVWFDSSFRSNSDLYTTYNIIYFGCL